MTADQKTGKDKMTVLLVEDNQAHTRLIKEMLKSSSQVIFKLDFMDIDNDAGTGVDQINVAMGYVF